MKRLRLILITRRFWPLVGGAETVMANLAGELLRQGVRPTILTARWSKTWPETFVFEDVPVVRLSQPAQRGWGTFRYMSSLSRWLRNHQDEYDIAYVSMLKHDAYTTVGTLLNSCKPVVLRAEGGGKTGDLHWQRTANFGSRVRARCVQADALVAISPAIEAEMIEAGYSQSRIHRINNGVSLAVNLAPRRRALARTALAEVNPQLRLPDGARLAIYTGRLHPEKGLDFLIKAWPRVMDHWPTARLWLVGSGSHSDVLQHQIRDLGLDQHVVLTGTFDSLEDILLAADLYILPSFEEGMSVALLEAMAYGLPSVATNIPGNRAVAGNGAAILLVPAEDSVALAAAIIRLWNDPECAVRMGTAARESVKQEFSLESVTRQHLELFRRLVADKSAQLDQSSRTN